MSKWYQKIVQIPGPIRIRKFLPEGAWKKCPECKKIIMEDEKDKLFYTCLCGYHFRIGSEEYFAFLFDDKELTELFDNIISKDPLNFEDSVTYINRLKSTHEKTGLNDAIRFVRGKIKGIESVLGAMDFSFIGGSMGSVVGEKIARAVDYCIACKLPLIIISKSGGARIMEGAFSLMQMAKTIAKINQLGEAGLPFVSILTDPTIGGVTASYALLGDYVLAEPDALIAYSTPKVIKESTGKDLPKGFQRAQYLYSHGMLDDIVYRRDMKEKIAAFLTFFTH